MLGILAMIAGMGAFVTNDGFAKVAGDTLPIGEIMAVRGVFAIAFVMLLAWWFGALRPIRQMMSWPVGGRIAGEVLSTVLFLTGLMHLPFAETNAIMQFTPLAVTAASAVFFREQVGWRRWTAALVGFIGVLLIVKPGTAAFSWWSLPLIFCVLAVVLRDLSTRRIDRDIPTLMITVMSAASVTVAGFVMGLTEVWVVPEPLVALRLAAAAIAIVVGYFCVTVSLRSGEMAVIAPFRYSVVLFAITGGYLVWGQVPDSLTLLGIAIVIAAGIYTFYRERLRMMTAARAKA